MFTTTIINAQTTKLDDIKTLLSVMESEKEIKQMVNSTLDLYAYKKTDVSKEVWEEIKTKVDYKDYMGNLTKIYDDNYSHSEIKKLSNEASKLDTTHKTTLLKPEVIELIYITSRKFGTSFSALVKQTLVDNGY